MSRKTWRDLARQQTGGRRTREAQRAPPADLASVAEQLPALQSLLEKRKALEARMQELGSSPTRAGQTPGEDPRFPVASMAERRAELERWARQHEQCKTEPAAALDQRPRQAPRDGWQALRDSQAGQAEDRARQLLAQKQSLMQRLDQRVNDARNKAQERLRNSRRETIQAPLSRPVEAPLTQRLDAARHPTRTERATTRESFDQRYKQRTEKLLGIAPGSTDDLAQRRDRQREQQRAERLEARRAERQAERQDMMKRERAQERRAQRPQLSTD
ncbi:hypothetical protein [Halopseudomonas salina]|uniref:Uncharacterized protein n=1 Tax=Halopseudomonas salina TaxID=1323744 RepID=A0ABQ1PD30_9GAMM|nr:hypothetical protein [Halopseudomonas salina]GGC94846.1 hypothetical protein GCM10007418_13040 [Halopseudomonas salina]